MFPEKLYYSFCGIELNKPVGSKFTSVEKSSRAM